MTRRLSVILEAHGLEWVEADVLVVAYGETERPLRGAAARIDWRLCGRLSALIERGALFGRSGEAALLTGGGGVRAPVVLGLGLGAVSLLDAARIRALARDATERVLALGAERVALPLVAGGDACPAADRMGATVEGAAEALVGRAEDQTLSLRIVAAPEDLPAAAEWMRRTPQRSLPEVVELHLPSASPAPRAASMGAHAGSQPLRPLVK